MRNKRISKEIAAAEAGPLHGGAKNGNAASNSEADNSTEFRAPAIPDDELVAFQAQHLLGFVHISKPLAVVMAQLAYQTGRAA